MPNQGNWIPTNRLSVGGRPAPTTARQTVEDTIRGLAGNRVQNKPYEMGPSMDAINPIPRVPFTPIHPPNRLAPTPPAFMGPTFSAPMNPSINSGMENISSPAQPRGNFQDFRGILDQLLRQPNFLRQIFGNMRMGPTPGNSIYAR
jgi:hypothetical protein